MATEFRSPKELIRRIRELLTTGRQDVLLALLEELQPYDIASLLPSLTLEEQRRLVSLLSPEVAAEAIEHLDYDHQYRIIDHLEQEKARQILAAMSTDAVVDLAGAIHPLQARALLELVTPEKREPIERLMTYPENSVGALMTLEYLAVREGWTADQVIAHFRKVGARVEVANYVYVVNGQGQLVGVASLRDVLLSPPGTPMAEIMYTKVISVPVDADREVAARLLSQYDFVALPVVDANGRMVGVVTHDDVLDVIQEEATEDIHRLGGTEPLEEPYLRARLGTLVRKRIVWLLLLFLAQSVTTSILRHYEEALEMVVALAFFIPLLIDTGGNAGSQASTLVVRALALGQVSLRDVFRIVALEGRVALTLGAVMGSVSLLWALVLQSQVGLAATVALSVTLVVLVASIVGALLPLVAQRLGFDPAVFSSPIITTVADAVGLLIYFKIARTILGL